MSKQTKLSKLAVEKAVREALDEVYFEMAVSGKSLSEKQLKFIELIAQKLSTESDA